VGVILRPFWARSPAAGGEEGRKEVGKNGATVAPRRGIMGNRARRGALVD